jgi:two-component system sensor histidine kinase GlrK
VGAIVTAIVQVDGVADESREAMLAVQENANASRLLADRVQEMERTARLHQALADPAFRNLYDQHRAEARALIDRLGNANDRSALGGPIERVRVAEQAATDTVDAIGAGTTREQVERAFRELSEAVLMVVQSHAATAREAANAMPAAADELQTLLVTQATLAIPLSAGLAVLFALLIARPLRKLERGIRTLGKGTLVEPIRVTGARDLAELGMRLEDLRLRLLELEAQKARFLRNVSHELKTPLSNIRESVELLVEDVAAATSAERHAILRILRSNSVRLQHMIEDLLRYGADSDLDAEHLQERTRFDRVVRGAIERTQSVLAARGVELETALDVVEVLGNDRRLEVIVDNLISNAVKFTPREGRIRIELHMDEEVRLDVIDSGPGVRPEDAAHLFEWFYTGRRDHEALVPGTGMGLAIAQEYAQQHGGRIESLASDAGAHFRLTLPEIDDHAQD